MTPVPWVTLLPMHLRACLTDAARNLTDRQYVLGMLRAVISCSRNEDTAPLEEWVVVTERGGVVYGYVVPPTTRLLEITRLADSILTQPYAAPKDFEWFGKLCEAQLQSNGEDWVATVNQLGLDAQ